MFGASWYHKRTHEPLHFIHPEPKTIPTMLSGYQAKQSIIKKDVWRRRKGRSEVEQSVECVYILWVYYMYGCGCYAGTQLMVQIIFWNYSCKVNTSFLISRLQSWSEWVFLFSLCFAFSKNSTKQCSYLYKVCDQRTVSVLWE